MSEIKCPSGHTRVWKKGTVPTVKGPKTRYVCFTCGRSFYAAKPKPEKEHTRKKAAKKEG